MTQHDRTQLTLVVTFEHIWLATITEAIGLHLPMQLIILHLTKKSSDPPVTGGSLLLKLYKVVFFVDKSLRNNVPF
ncbi:hypothetical protein BSK50_00955 [Paenibacillus odorifer]|nr:hypothetical protein BSK50_00955 [Paenibacillus odorifer]